MVNKEVYKLKPAKKVSIYNAENAYIIFYGDYNKAIVATTHEELLEILNLLMPKEDFNKNDDLLDSWAKEAFGND